MFGVLPAGQIFINYIYIYILNHRLRIICRQQYFYSDFVALIFRTWRTTSWMFDCFCSNICLILETATQYDLVIKLPILLASSKTNNPLSDSVTLLPLFRALICLMSWMTPALKQVAQLFNWVHNWVVTLSSHAERH